jgi:N-acetylglucosaminyldiphosphoundecaprenol N-acetyl-beta-D-mannosaminyltransferase
MCLLQAVRLPPEVFKVIVMRQVYLLNVGIHNITVHDLLQKLKAGGAVFTPNADHLVKLQHNAEFYAAYQAADYRVCDSQVLLFIAKLLGTPIAEKISGSDLFPAFYQHYRHDESVKIFLLGAGPGVARRAQQKINAKLGREMIVAAHSPSFQFAQSPEESRQIIDMINQSGATVLAMGAGSPKQEIWIAKYKDQFTHVKTFLAIGATIDFEAGNVPRSPKWVSEAGLEWLYRLCNEPKRLWKRYLVDDSRLIWFVLIQWLRLYQNPWLTEPDYAPKQVAPMQNLRKYLKRFPV